MSNFELKNKSGFIFKNEYKKEDKHPEYKGQIKWDDQLIDIALFVKEKNGKKYFGVALNEPYEKNDLPESKVDQETDDLPF